jgi:ABC-type transport system involved in Fe-S cluster assembly fused permease/ATPase subunit
MVELQGGSIEIDGVNIRDIGLATLRERLAFVPQDSVLFVSFDACVKLLIAYAHTAGNSAREPGSADN